VKGGKSNRKKYSRVKAGTGKKLTGPKISKEDRDSRVNRCERERKRQKEMKSGRTQCSILQVPQRLMTVKEVVEQIQKGGVKEENNFMGECQGKL